MLTGIWNICVTFIFTTEKSHARKAHESLFLIVLPTPALTQQQHVLAILHLSEFHENSPTACYAC